MLHLAVETLNKLFFTMMVCVAFIVVLESPADEDEPKTLTKAKTMYRSCMDMCKYYYTHTHTIILEYDNIKSAWKTLACVTGHPSRRTTVMAYASKRLQITLLDAKCIAIENTLDTSAYFSQLASLPWCTDPYTSACFPFKLALSYIMG